MGTVVDNFVAAKSLLLATEGTVAHAACSKGQRDSLKKSVANTRVSSACLAQIVTLVRETPFLEDHRQELLQAIGTKATADTATTEGRCQNYEACLHFIPQYVWSSMEDADGPEELCKFLVRGLKLFKPSEGTYATISAGLLLASEGPDNVEKALGYTAKAKNQFLKACKGWFKAALAGVPEPSDLLRALPSSSAALQELRPDIYDCAFSHEAPAKIPFRLAHVEIYKSGGWWRMHAGKAATSSSRQLAAHEQRSAEEPGSVRDMMQCMMQGFMSAMQMQSSQAELPISFNGNTRAARMGMLGHEVAGRHRVPPGPSGETSYRGAPPPASGGSFEVPPPPRTDFETPPRPVVAPYVAVSGEKSALPSDIPVGAAAREETAAAEPKCLKKSTTIEEASKIALEAITSRSAAKAEKAAKKKKEKKEKTIILKRPAAAAAPNEKPTKALRSEMKDMDSSKMRLDHEASRTQFLLRIPWAGSKARFLFERARCACTHAHRYTRTIYIHTRTHMHAQRYTHAYAHT